MVELRPNELPEAVSCPWKSFRSGSKGRKYLYYRLYALSVADAIEWYQGAANGDVTLPQDSE